MSLMLRTLPAQSGTDMAPLPSVGLTHSAPWPGGFGVLLRFSSLVKRSVSHLKIPALSKDARGSIDPPGSFTHVRRLYLLTKVVLTYLSIFFLSPLSLQSLHPPSLSLLSVRPARRIVSLTLYRRARILVLSRAQAFSTGPAGRTSLKTDADGSQLAGSHVAHVRFSGNETSTLSKSHHNLVPRKVRTSFGDCGHGTLLTKLLAMLTKIVLFLALAASEAFTALPTLRSPTSQLASSPQMMFGFGGGGNKGGGVRNLTHSCSV